MFIAGIIFAILCVALFFIGKSNWLKILASALVIVVGVVFINEGKDQRKANQVADKKTEQSSSKYDDKYSGSDNSSTVPDASVTSEDTNQSDNSSGANQSSQSNPSGQSNSNQQGSGQQTTGLRDKYLKRLDNIQTQIDNMDSDDETTIGMKRAASARYKLWDDELNVIYQEIRSHMSDSEKAALKQEEIGWLEDRDEAAEEAAAEFKGGTWESLMKVDSLGNSTKERCYELVNTYMN